MLSIAVVIPTHNRMMPLVRAVRSVFRQTLRPAELIVVDDGSATPATTVLAEWPEIQVVTNPRRMGAAYSRNRGVSAAAADLIAFLDSDDFWAETKLEAQQAVFGTRPELDLVYCDQWIVTADGKHLPSGKALIEHDLMGHLLNFWTAPNTSTLMMRRVRFEQLGGFDESLSSCQDHDLWMRVARHDLRVACVAAPLSYFCFDQDDRITRSCRDRMAGVEAFLRKWETPITTAAGAERFRRFRNEYYMRAAFSLFLERLKAGRSDAWTLFWRYLATNPALYRKAFRRLLSIDGPH